METTNEVSGVQLRGFRALGEATLRQDQQVCVFNVPVDSDKSNGQQVVPDESRGHGKLAGTNNDEQFRIVWRRLSYTVDQSSMAQLISGSLGKLKSLFRPDAKLEQHCVTRRLVFDNLSGCANSGEITAILGPSGAGKTSLLNAICGRAENYTGSVQLVGGGRRRLNTAIIPQKDHLIENLTVRENLMFSSRILNEAKDFNHEANIMRVVEMLNLRDCLHSSCSSISGGEHKRVSIGQELLRQPALLILDEPTSGLDSMNCKNLVRLLKDLIAASRDSQPMAIIMTIHQPDVDVFRMFDHVYCMARGGAVIFDGQPSETLAVINTHAGLTDDHGSPELIPSGNQTNSLATNPANLLIEVASEQLFGRAPVERLANFQRKQLEHLIGHQPSRDYNGPAGLNQVSAIHDSRDTLVTMRRFGDSELSCDTSDTRVVHDKRLVAKVDHAGKFWYHTAVLARRTFQATARDPLMFLVSLLFHLSVPFGMWIVYSAEIGSVAVCPILERKFDAVSLISFENESKMTLLLSNLKTGLECSTMFFLTTYAFGLCSMGVAALTFPLSMHILLKEVRNGWYGMPSYVLAKTVSMFPFEVLFPTMSITLIFLLLGMPSSYLEWRMWGIALLMAMVAMVTTAQGLVFGALFMDDVQAAIFVACASTLPLICLSGFTARISLMPTVLQNLSLLSPYRYATEVTNMLRFGFGLCPCDEATDEYLRTNKPELTNVPRQVEGLVRYFLSNTAPSADNSEVSPLNETARNEVIRSIESGDTNFLDQLASLVAKSFSYGREIADCSAARSQLLVQGEVSEDKYLPYFFAGLLLLLAATKLILFLVVNYKIKSRL